jgi:NhaP-type Na+/H+ or K+/H+ antiporter
MIGFIGPRGTATIVFGLLAFNKLPDAESFDVLAVMVFTVVGSILMHRHRRAADREPRRDDGP